MIRTKEGDNKLVVAVNYAVSAICNENKLWYKSREIAIWAFGEASSDAEINAMVNNAYSLLKERNALKKKRIAAYKESKAIIDNLSFISRNSTEEYNSKMKEINELDYQIEMNMFQQSKNAHQIIRKWMDYKSLKEIQDRIQNLDIPTVFKDLLSSIVKIQSVQDKAESRIKELAEERPIDIRESKDTLFVNFLNKEKAAELLKAQVVINSNIAHIARLEGMLRKTLGKPYGALLNEQNSTK